MAVISDNTRKLHQQLLLVITIQAFLPCFLIIGFSIYLLEQFSIIKSVATEFLSMIFFAMLPLANPIVVLLGVKPYASAVRRIIAFVLRKMFRIKLGPRESSVKVTVASAS
ncbi:unnamed protein product [Caenorhabditis auriculariae]|uniref:G-protein coupled receptors family 1 profile domain-containing protein n=1 Tax=Caenorhabditis auriculariae TaxID=2777116 RepID=A0A8S1HIZ2_9PELO|nr:unnamed protein product [Caenorhabditis auriculariae]